MEFSKNLLRKVNEKIEIKDGWIEIRNENDQLLRKKRIRNYDAVNQNKDQMLRKLGILNSKEIAEHNHEIVLKRPSKYEFEDIYK